MSDDDRLKEHFEGLAKAVEEEDVKAIVSITVRRSDGYVMMECLGDGDQDFFAEVLELCAERLKKRLGTTINIPKAPDA